jgi:hypothetical protein
MRRADFGMRIGGEAAGNGYGVRLIRDSIKAISAIFFGFIGLIGFDSL